MKRVVVVSNRDHWKLLVAVRIRKRERGYERLRQVATGCDRLEAAERPLPACVCDEEVLTVLIVDRRRVLRTEVLSSFIVPFKTAAHGLLTGQFLE